MALLIASLACALAACRGAAPVAETREPEVPAEAAIDRSTAETFRIDGDASQVTILVYRAGPLSRLGHNHVITSRDLEGRVWLNDREGRSAIELSLPLQRLLIDDPAAREAAGPDFPGEIPPDDIAGTRKNMLGESLLDAAHYPMLRVRAQTAGDIESGPVLRAAVTVRGRVHTVDFPISVERDGDRLVAVGETTVDHTELGLEPFSVMMGALSVDEEIRLAYRIVARRGVER